MPAISIRGLTWNHPRGYRGLERATTRYQREHPGVAIIWERQPLEGFESEPIEALARRYDLLILDHPAMGDAATTECLLPLGPYAQSLDLNALEHDAVGPGLSLYEYAGRLWAIPLDAACQTAVFRRDLLARADLEPPRTLADVRELTIRVRAAAALRGVHGFLIFVAFCAHLGHPPFETPEAPVDEPTGLRALELLHELAALLVPESLTWNAIECLDAMSERDDLAYCPFIFSYASYSRAKAKRPLHFTDIPGVDRPDCAGAVVGGTGLAITRRCAHPREAVDFARYLTSPTVQVRMGHDWGQPGRASAWRDPGLNEAFNNFYLGTLSTMEQAHVRPRYPGYFAFQHAAGQIVEQALREHQPPRQTLASLVDGYHRSRIT